MTISSGMFDVPSVQAEASGMAALRDFARRLPHLA
jgi:hypothetical protein